MEQDNFRFLDWQVYKDAKELFSLVLEITKKLPAGTPFGVKDQLIRSALSILLNIAEGSGKSSDKDFARFLDIAMGSVYETYACIDTLHENNMLLKKDFEEAYILLKSIRKQLGGLKKKLKRVDC